jgi:hypothetical protein
MSVCLYVRMEKLGSHWTDFRNSLYWSIFRKSVDKIYVPLKSDSSNGYFYMNACVQLWYLDELFLEWGLF